MSEAGRVIVGAQHCYRWRTHGCHQDHHHNRQTLNCALIPTVLLRDDEDAHSCCHADPGSVDGGGQKVRHVQQNTRQGTTGVLQPAGYTQQCGGQGALPGSAVHCTENCRCPPACKDSTRTAYEVMPWTFWSLVKFAHCTAWLITSQGCLDGMLPEELMLLSAGNWCSALYGLTGCAVQDQYLQKVSPARL